MIAPAAKDVALATWIEGLRALSDREGRLHQQVLRDARRLWAGGWLALAAEHGWSTMALFGAHRLAPKHRLERKGLCVGLDGKALLSLDAAVAAIDSRGKTQRHFRKPDRNPRGEWAPIWEI